jgi:hypothetical protein
MQSFFVPLCPQAGNVTERLGRGLQNLLRRFESARYLKSPHYFYQKRRGLFRGQLT